MLRGDSQRQEKRRVRRGEMRVDARGEVYFVLLLDRLLACPSVYMAICLTPINEDLQYPFLRDGDV